MNASTHHTADPLPPDSRELRGQLVDHALARTSVVVRYRWQREPFTSIVVGRVSMVQIAHVAIVLCQRADVRVLPIACITSVTLDPKPPAEVKP